MVLVCRCCGVAFLLAGFTGPVSGMSCTGCGAFGYVCDNCTAWARDPKQPAAKQLAAATSKFSAQHAGH